MSPHGGRGRAAGGRGAPGVAQRPTDTRRTVFETGTRLFYRAGTGSLGS